MFRASVILAGLAVPVVAFAQTPSPEIPISVRTVQAAIQQLQNGGSYAQGQLIAADLNDQANAWLQRQQAIDEKQKADAAAAKKKEDAKPKIQDAVPPAAVGKP